MWAAPESGGWHLKWRQSYRRDLRPAGTTPAAKHPADLRELVSGCKWGRKYEPNWMKSLNREVVCKEPRERDSVRLSPHPGMLGSGLPCTGDGKDLCSAEKSQPLRPSNHSVLFLFLFFNKMSLSNIITTMFICIPSPSLQTASPPLQGLEELN